MYRPKPEYSLWFMCSVCYRAYLDVERLVQHKIQDHGEEEEVPRKSSSNKTKPGRSPAAAVVEPVRHSHGTRQNITAQTGKRPGPMRELSDVPVKRSRRAIKPTGPGKVLDWEEKKSKKPVKFVAARKKVSRRKVGLPQTCETTPLLKKVLTRNWIRVESSSESMKTEALFMNLSDNSSSGGVMGTKFSEDLDYSVLREQGKHLIALMKKHEKKRKSSEQGPRMSNPESEVVQASSAITDEESQIPIRAQQLEVGCFNHNNEGYPAKELSSPNEIIIDPVRSVQHEIPKESGTVCTTTHSKGKHMVSCPPSAGSPCDFVVVGY